MRRDEEGDVACASKMPQVWLMRGEGEHKRLPAGGRGVHRNKGGLKQEQQTTKEGRSTAVHPLGDPTDDPLNLVGLVVPIIHAPLVARRQRGPQQPLERRGSAGQVSMGKGRATEAAPRRGRDSEERGALRGFGGQGSSSSRWGGK